MRRKKFSAGSIIKDKKSVSPIVGTILVLTISILGISSILFWGVPSISRVQGQSQFNSVLRQFDGLHDLMTDKLLHSTGSADKYTISASSGNMMVYSSGNRWVISYSVSSGYDFLYLDLDDTDDTFTIKNNGTSIANLQVSAEEIIGSTYGTLYARGSGNSSVSGALATNGEKAIYLKDSDWASQPISGLSFYFSISDGGTLKAEFFLFDAGKIEYKSSLDYTNYRVIEENGGTIATQGSYEWIRNAPILSTTTVSGSTQVIMHIIQVNGSGGISASAPSGAQLLISRTSSGIEMTSNLADKTAYKLRISVYAISSDNSDSWLAWLDELAYMAAAEAGSVLYSASSSVGLALFRTAFSVTVGVS